MGNLMTLIRHLLGRPTLAVAPSPADEEQRAEVLRRLNTQKIRLARMDAELDAIKSPLRAGGPK